MSDSTKKTTRLFRPAGIAIGAAAVAMVAIPLTFASAEMRPGPDGERFAASQGEHGGHHMRGHQGRGGHHMRGRHGDGGKRLEKMFERADLNGDGTVSADEVEKIRAERFARVDLDGDGNLTIQEIAKVQENARQAMRDARALRSVANARGFTKADADENGSISAEEYASKRERFFERLDADGDGNITAEEISAAKERFQDRRGGPGRHGKGPGHHGRGGDHGRDNG